MLLFFGNAITGDIDPSCMNAGLNAVGVSTVQRCVTAYIFTNQLAQKEKVNKAHVSIARIHEGERSCATRIFNDAGVIDENKFQEVFGSLKIITPLDLDKIIAKNSARDQPDSILKVAEYVRWFFDAKIAAPGEAKTLFHLIADVKDKKGIPYAISQDKMYYFFTKGDEIWEELADKVRALTTTNCAKSPLTNCAKSPLLIVMAITGIAIVIFQLFYFSNSNHINEL